MRINIDEMLDPGPELVATPTVRGRRSYGSDSDSDVTSDVDDFESLNTARNFPIEVKDQFLSEAYYSPGNTNFSIFIIFGKLTYYLANQL